MTKISFSFIIIAFSYFIFAIHNSLIFGSPKIINPELFKYYIDVKNPATNFLQFFFLAPLLFFTLSLINIFINSKFNNSIVEKKISNILKIIPTIKINKISYISVTIIIFSMTIIFIFDSFITILRDINQIADVDYTIMKDSASFTSYSQNHLTSFFLFVFFLLLFLKPKQSLNSGYFWGFAFIPFFSFNFFFNNIYTYFINFPTYLTDSIFAPQTYNWFVISLCFILTGMLLVFFKSKKCIQFSIYFILGTVINAIITFFTLLAIANLYNVSAANPELNNRSVLIDNISYNYNLSNILTHKDYEDNDRIEYLIESYAGVPMSNAEPLFSKMFSVNFQGDHEKSYQLFAKIYSANLKKIEGQQANILNKLKENTSLSLSTTIMIVISNSYYSISPYENSKSTIQNIIDKDYQKAVDNYIKFGLNSSDLKTEFSIHSKNYNNVGFKGIPSYQDMIASIIQQGHATMDFEKIKDEKNKNYWKNRVNQPDFGLYTDFYSENEFQDLFSTFNIK